MKRAVLVLIAFVTTLATSVHANQIESDLARTWKHRVVIVRIFPVGDRVIFDRNGDPIGSPRRGHWASEGLVRIRKISVDADEVRFKCRRVIEFRNGDRFNDINTKRDIEIRLQLDPSWHDTASLAPLLSKVFLYDLNDLATVVPDYWRSWCKRVQRDDKGWTIKPDAAKPAQANPKPPANAQGTNHSGEATVQPTKDVYNVGGGVSAPRGLSTPDPEYPEVARKAKLQGSVLLWLIVDRNGDAQQIRIDRALGAGFDDLAVETVRRWTFAPATRNGEPVPVMINVEVNYHLY